ncbi:hypothetical protein E2F50_04590 [Rhizobium deserti]|uniref:Outer membrane beta-barrel protein n=1 Tax=Rhizobium deserti TaxID=2547961 RepID=A0A4R5UNP4_9HYPH|nr:outer membrane beta-barrel protein [Rhizobium deserti]TDK39398.1 hypothetical protein E2F50_04590 [Rhizobium deserti]
MKSNTISGTTLNRRRKALGLLLACSALGSPLLSPLLATAQTLFPSQASPLPGLSDQQFGTAGTTTVTTNAGTTTGSALPSANAGTAPGTGTENESGSEAPATPTSPQASAAAERDTPFEEDLNQPYDQSLDADSGAGPIDQQEQPRVPGDPTGIRLGTFMLRPSVNQSINTEITRSGGAKLTRNYLATGIRGSLSSDWSRHSLTVTGDGTFEKDLSGGKRNFEPEGTIAADLRLDLADDTIAHVTGGYSFAREDNDDPNAVGGATEQSGVHQFNGGLSVERDLGLIRGLAALDATRYIYTDAELSGGNVISMKDRNRSGVDGRLRLGYELSPALIPFAEVAAGHTFYDRRRDSSGYERSSQSYAARSGVEFDFGEKLRGEIGTGYQVVDYDDSRLNSIDALTLDGNATWSPQRGTDVNLGLRTSVQDTTTAGESGWVEYELTAALAHEMRDNLIGRLSGSTVLRDFQGGTSDGKTWVAGAGLTWAINPYLDVTGDVEYEQSSGSDSSDQDIIRAGLGLTLKR